MTTAMSPLESRRLSMLEDSIAKGLKTFVEVGSALAEIRDSRLYRQTHGAFEGYCRDRWGMSKTHANRLVESATVVRDVAPIGAIPPANEAQARPLTRVPPEQRAEVWNEVVSEAPKDDAGKPKVTAAQVEAKVRERIAPIPASSPNDNERAARLPRRPPYTARMQTLIDAAVSASIADDAEIDAVPANDMMLRRIIEARDLLTRIIERHSNRATA